MPRWTGYIIEIDGQDVTSTCAPLLISGSVTLKAGGESDKADITLDDTGGQIKFPRDGVSMTIKLRGVGKSPSEVFRGKVTEVRSRGSRGGGREVQITADGVDTKGKAKQPQEKHWDNKSVKTILEEAGKAAGITSIKVDGAIGAIIRTYEFMGNESFMAFGQRLAEELGGTFAISDGRAALVERSAGKSASGKALTKITAAAGDNLLSWDIAPVEGRQRYKKVRQRYYDRKTAKWQFAEVDVADDGAVATHSSRFASPDKTAAERKAKSDKTASEREKGSGTVGIDGNEFAQPEAPISVSGARPGIDGDYVIDSVTHSLKRGGGFDTSLEIKKPGGSAGKDGRKPSASKSAGGAQSSSAAKQGAAIKADSYATP